MKTFSIAILGASGLVGQHLLQLASAHPAIHSITVINRRQVGYQDAKVIEKTIDFNDLNAYKTALLGAEIIYCAIGTTKSAVKGNKKRYRQIDEAIPCNAMRLADQCHTFALISAIGANPKSLSFYARLKGEVEQHLLNSTIAQPLIFRPSLLLGQRKEKRTMENFASRVIPKIAALLPAQYRPINARDVAQAMLMASLNPQQSPSILTYQEMMQLNPS